MTENAPSSRFPLFIVAGMPRGGTTFLYHNLKKHPGIFLPYRKEVNFFNVLHDRGAEWYNALYAERQPHQVAGDISPPCFMDPDSLQRIKAYNPEAKIILVVRDPAEWALSFYRQFQTFTFKMPSFSEFLEGYDFHTGGKVLRVDFKENKIVDRINLFRDAFGSNMLIYHYTYFKKNVLTVLQAIERFIGVDAYFQEGTFDDVKINASQRKNIRIVSYLLSREWLIAAIERAVPRHVTLYLRDRFDRHSARKGKDQKGYSHPEAHVRLAERELDKQRRILDDMFNKHPVQTGSGIPFS